MVSVQQAYINLCFLARILVEAEAKMLINGGLVLAVKPLNTCLFNIIK